MADQNFMDKWLGKTGKDEISQKDCNEFLLNWVRAMAFGGRVKQGSFKAVEQDFRAVAQKMGVELWQDKWIKDVIKNDK